MKKLLVIAAMFLAGASLAKAQNAEAAVQDDGTLVKVGDMAPDFKVEMLDGSTVSLSDLRGKVVLLNFWATWCPYCVQEMDSIQTGFIDRYAGMDVVFLPVSRGEARDVVVEFVAKKGYGFPIGIDPGSKIWDLYATKSIPRNFIIDREGRIAGELLGYSPEEFTTVLDMVDTLLK